MFEERGDNASYMMTDITTPLTSFYRRLVNKATFITNPNDRRRFVMDNGASSLRREASAPLLRQRTTRRRSPVSNRRRLDKATLITNPNDGRRFVMDNVTSCLRREATAPLLRQRTTRRRSLVSSRRCLDPRDVTWYTRRGLTSHATWPLVFRDGACC